MFWKLANSGIYLRARSGSFRVYEYTSVKQLLLADSAISSPSKSQLTYNSLLIRTGPSALVVAFSSCRPQADLGFVVD
jgi:hypothetical protein